MTDRRLSAYAPIPVRLAPLIAKLDAAIDAHQERHGFPEFADGHRAILDLHGPYVLEVYCGECRSYTEWPCKTVLALARIYEIDLSIPAGS